MPQLKKKKQKTVTLGYVFTFEALRASLSGGVGVLVYAISSKLSLS